MAEQLGERFAVSQKNGTVNPLGRRIGPAEEQYDHCTPEWCDQNWPAGAPWAVFAVNRDSAGPPLVEVPRKPAPMPIDTAVAAWQHDDRSLALSLGDLGRLGRVANAVLDAHWHERLTDGVLEALIVDTQEQGRNRKPWDFDRLRRVAAAASKGAGG